MMALLGPVALLLAVLLAGAAPASAAATPPSPTWSALSPPAGPPGLHDASAAYDAANQTIVVFGGQTANGSASSATWVWSGSTWTQAVPQVQGPAARFGASLAYSRTLNQLILFGGMGAGGPLSDTWAWNGVSWVALAPSVSPPGREDASFAVDGNGNLVLFGGTGTVAASTPANLSPPTTTAAAQGAAAPSQTTTAPAVSASDTAASASLGVLDDTWLWTGSNWVAQTGPEPPARTGATLTWDPTLGVTVLFGGSGTPVGTAATPLADTWSWDGSAWSQAVPVASPPARTQAVADFTTSLGGVVVTTGTGATGALDDTWTYDGTTWNALPAATPLAARSDAAAAWDAATQQLVVFGGIDAHGATLSDTAALTATAPVTATPTPTGSTASTSTTASAGSTSSPPTSGHSSSSSLTTGRAATTHANGSPATTAPAGHTTPVAEGAPTPVTPGPDSPAVQTVHGGSLVTLLGSGFRPGASITITFHSTPSTVGRVVADAAGSFSATVTVPSGASPGRHHLVATGMSRTGRVTSLVTPLRVVPLAGAPARRTPTVTTLTMVAVAVLLPVATWSALALRTRRRSLATTR
jgi:hypothetical protein